jgi:hypothetical protein
MSRPRVFSNRARALHRWALPLAALPLAALPLTLTACESLLSPPQYAQVDVAIATTSGDPVPDVPVNLYTGQRPLEYAATNAAGVYTFERVPPGLYGVTITVPQGLGDGASPYLSQDDLRIERGDRRTVTFTLTPCHGSLLVTVRDASGGAVDVPITLYAAAGIRDSARTAADGTHRFSSVACGTYGVRLEPNTGYVVTPGAGTAYQEGLRLTPTVSSLALTFLVQRCRATIHSRVLDAAGAGVPGATLTVYTAAGALVSGVTGSDGTFVFASTPCGRELGMSVTPPTGFSPPPNQDGLHPADGSSIDVVFRLTRS